MKNTAVQNRAKILLDLWIKGQVIQTQAVETLWPLVFLCLQTQTSLEKANSFSEDTPNTEKNENSGLRLFYFNARWYDPTLGRFVTEDPARDQINWYGYCMNNPLRYTDPTGMLTDEHRAELKQTEDSIPVFTPQKEREKIISEKREALMQKERETIANLQKNLDRLEKIKDKSKTTQKLIDDYKNLIEDLMGAYDRDTPDNAQNLLPGSTIQGTFKQKYERIKLIEKDMFLTTDHTGADLTNDDTQVISDAYYKIISINKDMIVLEKVGNEKQIRIPLEHLNPSELSKLNALMLKGSYIVPNQPIAHYGLFGDTTGPHLHAEMTGINDNGKRGFLNPLSGDEWTSEYYFSWKKEQKIIKKDDTNESNVTIIYNEIKSTIGKVAR